MKAITPAIQFAIEALAQAIASELASDCEADALLPEVENDVTSAVEHIMSDFTPAPDGGDFDDHNFGNAAW